MSYQKTQQPTWLYKPIEVKNLAQIQNEILPILLRKMPNFIHEPYDFFQLLPEDIITYAPSYVEFIKTFGIYERWYMSAVITTNKGIDFPIHVDSRDWNTVCYGLNIPIINCEGSYTVWYDTEIGGPFHPPGDFRERACHQKEGSPAKEIGRWDANKPAWINVSIPHRPESAHIKPRAVLSARFEPDLHDLLHE